MDWIFIVLTIAFIIWSGQIVYSYRRRVALINNQIEAARITKLEIAEQAEQYEVRAERLSAEKNELEQQVSSWTGKEESIKKLVDEKNQRDASRRPTRFKVDKPESDAT